MKSEVNYVSNRSVMAMTRDYGDEWVAKGRVSPADQGGDCRFVVLPLA